MGLQAVLWAFSWTVSRNPRAAFARGVDLGGSGCICRRLKRGVHGRVDAANMAQGGRRAPALPWWAFARAGGDAEGDGGGLLANTGLNSGNSPEGARDCSLGPCWP